MLRVLGSLQDWMGRGPGDMNNTSSGRYQASDLERKRFCKQSLTSHCNIWVNAKDIKQSLRLCVDDS